MHTKCQALYLWSVLLIGKISFRKGGEEDGNRQDVHLCLLFCESFLGIILIIKKRTSHFRAKSWHLNIANQMGRKDLNLRGVDISALLSFGLFPAPLHKDFFSPEGTLLFVSFSLFPLLTSRFLEFEEL